MKAYHGTIVQDLKILRPFANPDSNLSFACVYLTKLLPLASLYIWNKPYKWMNYGFTSDGIIEYTESFPNALEEFYGGLSGSIYECHGDFEQNPNTRVPTAVISREMITVEDEITVKNALDSILTHEREGRIIIHRFETLDNKQREREHQMIFNFIKDQNLLTTDHPYKEFIISKFPYIWDEAQATQNG